MDGLLFVGMTFVLSVWAEVVFDSFAGFDCVVFVLEGDEGYGGWAELFFFALDRGDFGLD